MEERQMILKMLDEGKITASEAEKLLKALQEKKVEDEFVIEDHEESYQGGATPSPFIDWKGWKERKQHYRQDSTVKKASRFIENLVQKVKDVDLDFNFGSYETVNHIFQHEAPKSLEKVLVSVKNGDLTFHPWEEEIIQLDCQAKVYRASNVTEARQRFIEQAVFDVTDESMAFRLDRRDIKVAVNVYVPKKTYENVQMSSFNGDLEGEGLVSRSMALKTVNGKLDFASISVNDLAMETGNGAITLRDMDVTTGELETINGGITVEGHFKELEAESLNGAIEVEVLSPGHLELHSVTGSINVHVPVDVQVNGQLRSAVGALSCELQGFEVLREKKDIAQRLLKFVANKKSEELLALDAQSKTGTITVDANA